ncbi:unnamed protein product [Acanthoscelides obtectus]|nr:unnamed protein product [Acanthoscelides obtectus]CAK1637812.1 hypothetical protein AOBTE_LOCUS10211 [Acanthoscelides obtectus]
MLSGIILVVFIMCYCCHRTNRKSQSNLPTYWRDPGLSMEIYTVEAAQNWLMSEDMSYEVHHRPPTPGPPPAYDAVVHHHKTSKEDESDLPSYETAIRHLAQVHPYDVRYTPPETTHIYRSQSDSVINRPRRNSWTINPICRPFQQLTNEASNTPRPSSGGVRQPRTPHVISLEASYLKPPEVFPPTTQQHLQLDQQYVTNIENDIGVVIARSNGMLVFDYEHIEGAAALPQRQHRDIGSTDRNVRM